jgi:hypothetical protein
MSSGLSMVVLKTVMYNNSFDINKFEVKFQSGESEGQ